MTTEHKPEEIEALADSMDDCADDWADDNGGRMESVLCCNGYRKPKAAAVALRSYAALLREREMGGGEMKSASTIRKAKKDLRALVDSSSDPIVCRIAYAMETTLIWATEKTFGWSPPAQDAVELSNLIRKELQKP